MLRAPTASDGLNYRDWQFRRIRVASLGDFDVATKAGVFAHGHPDPSSEMLAEAMAKSASQVVVSFACGNGTVGAAAVRASAECVWLTDRHGLACDAARRTMLTNGGDAARVVLGHGAASLPDGLQADTVTIRVVPERSSMDQLLFDAMQVLKPGGRCYVAGANDEGARPAARTLASYCGAVRLEAQRAGHRMVSGVRPVELPTIPSTDATPYFERDRFFQFEVVRGAVRYQAFTRPGVFSWSHLDEASGHLLDVLTTQLAPDFSGRVLDLGCGAGVLGLFVALRAPKSHVTLVDDDSEAVRCATHSARVAGATNAEAMVSDIAGAVLTQSYDLVVTNPPFHVGKHTALDLSRQFVHDAWSVLQSRGRLLLVANRTLPYESVLQHHFGRVETLFDGARFKVLQAVKD